MRYYIVLRGEGIQEEVEVTKEVFERLNGKQIRVIDGDCRSINIEVEESPLDILSKNTGWSKEYCQKVMECDTNFLSHISSIETQDVLSKLTKLPKQCSWKILEFVLPRLIAITFLREGY